MNDYKFMSHACYQRIVTYILPLSQIARGTTDAILTVKVLPSRRKDESSRIIVNAAPDTELTPGIELLVYDGDFPYDPRRENEWEDKSLLELILDFFKFGDEPCNELLEGVKDALRAFQAIDYLFFSAHTDISDDEEPQSDEAEEEEPFYGLEELETENDNIKW